LSDDDGWTFDSLEDFCDELGLTTVISQRDGEVDAPAFRRMCEALNDWYDDIMAVGAGF
jgi:hypothetical protein